MKILFLVPYPTEGPSNRVRVEQFIPYLESEGIACKIRPFMNRTFYNILYLPHKYLHKAFWMAVCTLNRMADLFRAINYDMIFIHREAYPLGGPIFESILHRMGKRIIFDFDDSIFMHNTSRHNIYIEKFKRPEKVSKIIRMSSIVIVGNEYLREYALKYNKRVVLIPTSVNTDRYIPVSGTKDTKEIVIGWVGSNTTKEFLYDIEDIFVDLSRRYNNLVFKIVGANFYSFKLDNVISKKWALDEEVEDIRSFDIGVMPMPDNEWTRGKCGFKVIQYMASAIPAVCSPVGINSVIIDDGVSGFLAKDRQEWIDRLSMLIDDKELRGKVGIAGRRKVEEHYSVKVNAPKLVEAILGAYNV